MAVIAEFLQSQRRAAACRLPAQVGRRAIGGKKDRLERLGDRARVEIAQGVDQGARLWDNAHLQLGEGRRDG